MTPGLEDVGNLVANRRCRCPQGMKNVVEGMMIVMLDSRRQKEEIPSMDLVVVVVVERTMMGRKGTYCWKLVAVVVVVEVSLDSCWMEY